MGNTMLSCFMDALRVYRSLNIGTSYFRATSFVTYQSAILLCT